VKAGRDNNNGDDRPQPLNPYLPPTHPANAGTLRAPQRAENGERRQRTAASEILRDAFALLHEYQAELEAADPVQEEAVFERTLALLRRLEPTRYSINVAIAALRQQAALEAEEGLAPRLPEIDESSFDGEATYTEKLRAALVAAKWLFRHAPRGCLHQLAHHLLFQDLNPKQRREVLRRMGDDVRSGTSRMHVQNEELGYCSVCGQEGVAFDRHLRGGKRRRRSLGGAKRQQGVESCQQVK
jgi:hypothetical protein